MKQNLNKLLALAKKHKTEITVDFNLGCVFIAASSGQKGEIYQAVKKIFTDVRLTFAIFPTSCSYKPSIVGFFKKNGKEVKL